MKTAPFDWLARFLFALALMVGTVSLAAQTPEAAPVFVKILLLDGTELIGTIKSETADAILLDSETVGEVSVPRSAIDTILTVNKGKNGKIRPDDRWKYSPLESSNLVGPTGYGLKKGSSWVRNQELLFFQYNYGLTDHVSLGATSFFVPLIFPTFIYGKLSVPYRTGKGSAALYSGFLANGSLASSANAELDHLFVAYGVNTWGTRNNQLSVGTGYAFHRGAGSDQNFFYSASFIRRWNSRWALLSDNFLVRTHRGFVAPVSLGVRHFGRRFHFDLAWAVAFETDYATPPSPFFVQERTVTVPIPFFSFSRPMVKKVKNGPIHK